jgi:hypothetical protein
MENSKSDNCTTARSVIELPPEFGESRRLQAEYLARRFGLPPVHAGLLATLAFATSEAFR